MRTPEPSTGGSGSPASGLTARSPAGVGADATRSGGRDVCPCPTEPPDPILGTGTAHRPPAGPSPGIEFTLLNAGQDDLKRLLTSLPNSRHLTWADFSSVTAQHCRDPASLRCQTLCVQPPRQAGRRPLLSFVITSSLVRPFIFYPSPLLSPCSFLLQLFMYFSQFSSLSSPQGHAAHFHTEYLLSEPGPFTGAYHKYAF